MPDDMKPLTEEEVEALIETDNNSLQSTLEEYHRAVEEEFTEKDQRGVDELRERMGELVVDAETAIEYLVRNAESESVRLSAAKFVFQLYYGKRLDDAPGDPMTKLLQELKKND